MTDVIHLFDPLITSSFHIDMTGMTEDSPRNLDSFTDPTLLTEPEDSFVHVFSFIVH